MNTTPIKPLSHRALIQKKKKKEKENCIELLECHLCRMKLQLFDLKYRKKLYSIVKYYYNLK